MFVQVYFSVSKVPTDGTNDALIFVSERRPFQSTGKAVLQSVVDYFYEADLSQHSWYKTEHWKLIDQTRSIQKGF